MTSSSDPDRTDPRGSDRFMRQPPIGNFMEVSKAAIRHRRIEGSNPSPPLNQAVRLKSVGVDAHPQRSTGLHRHWRTAGERMSSNSPGPATSTRVDASACAWSAASITGVRSAHTRVERQPPARRVTTRWLRVSGYGSWNLESATTTAAGPAGLRQVAAQGLALIPPRGLGTLRSNVRAGLPTCFAS